MFLLTQLPQVNLLKDAWLLPVHGHGTFADPFEVDISLLELIEIVQKTRGGDWNDSGLNGGGLGGDSSCFFFRFSETMGGWIFLQLWEMWSPSFGIPTGTQVSGSLCYKFVILIQLHVQMATIYHLLSVILIGHIFICTGSYPKPVVQVQWPNIVLLVFSKILDNFYNKYNLLLTVFHPPSLSGFLSRDVSPVLFS